MIRHVLQALQIHTMAALNLPRSILKQLEGMFSKFLWGYNDQPSRRVWRAWDRIAFPVQENGLGVRKLDSILETFTCKMWWKIQHQSGIWAAYLNGVTI